MQSCFTGVNSGITVVAHLVRIRGRSSRIAARGSTVALVSMDAVRIGVSRRMVVSSRTRVRIRGKASRIAAMGSMAL